MLKNDKNVGIGAIDCEKEQAVCQRYGVSGYPTLKAIVGGKGKSYNGAREAEPIKEWITRLAQNRGTKGGSSKCPQGVFKSKVKDAAVPLCEEHFPDEKAKHAWLVFMYEQAASSAAELKGALNRLAVDMGNDPPDMSKALKKPKKKRDRLNELASTYDIKLSLPAKGPFGMEALIKVGAVCCDCGEEAAAFCASSMRIGEEELKPPRAFWVSQGKRTLLKTSDPTGPALAREALTRLGFMSSEGRDASEL